MKSGSLDSEIFPCCFLWAVSGHEEAMSEYEDDVLALLPLYGAQIVGRIYE